MTSYLKKVCIISLFILISFLLNGTAFCIEIASVIELHDGTVFNDVSFSVNNEYKTIKIIIDDNEQSVSFTDIAIIRDADGNDVTADYIGSYYVPADKQAEIPADKQEAKPETKPEEKQEVWISKETDTYRKTKQAKYQVSFGIDGNFSIPMGEYYEGFTSGIGLGGNITIPVTNNIAIKAIISKSGVKASGGTDKITGQPYNDILDISVWRYFLNVQYYSQPKHKEGKRNIFYTYTGMGAVSHSLKGKGILEGDYSESKFAMTVGVGYVPMFSPNMGVDLGASFDLLFIGAKDYDDYTYSPYGNVQTALLFDLKIGFLYFLWGKEDK